jgi:hypothetical protein
VGVGKRWQSGEKNSLDISSQYPWTHSEGDKARLKGATAMRLDFDDADSSRLRGRAAVPPCGLPRRVKPRL